jgi:pyruvate formate lyase activating enzyme
MLPIKGLQKTTLIDYPKKTASVIFLGGCDFHCPYCQNKDLVLNYVNLPTIKEEEILEFLNKRKKYIDGVVISGGEPCLYKELPNFISRVKNLGFLIKLDTNGSNPVMLKELIDKKLIDYIAMDIKAPLSKYEFVTKVKINKENIKKSINLIKTGDIDYEMRITIVPRLITKKDIREIGNWLKGIRKFYIQQFRPITCLDKSFEKIKPFSVGELKEFQKILKEGIKKVEIRGID